MFFINLDLLNVGCVGPIMTVDYLLTSCHVIVQSCYKKYHDTVAQIVHWELAKRGDFNLILLKLMGSSSDVCDAE